MQTTSNADGFSPAIFSVREREVVDMAIKGYTDEQIAKALDLSTSTVNSYWMRIRGKIGQLSRTEIAAKMLQIGFQDEKALLHAEIRSLREKLSSANAVLLGTHDQAAVAEGVDWHLLALHFAAEAMLIMNGPGDVVYANLQAERLFHCEPSELNGRPLCELTSSHGREARRVRIREFMDAESPGRLALGLHEPCYACPEGGEEFRVTVVLERFDADPESMAVITVKEFLADIEDIARSLRKPIVLE